MWVEGNANYKENPFTKNTPHLVHCNYGKWSFKKGEIPNYMTNYFWNWVKVWRWSKKGFLPYAGGWMEQPWKAIKICEVFDNIYNEKVK